MLNCTVDVELKHEVFYEKNKKNAKIPTVSVGSPRTNTIRIRSIATVQNAKDVVINYASAVIIAIKSVILFGMRP